MPNNYVLASVSGRQVFNFYADEGSAREEMARVNREYANFNGAPYEPMTYTEYLRRERSFWLDQPATQITAEKWNDMLEILPPMAWRQKFNFNSFLMREMMSGTFTHQYVRYGHGENVSYWQKMVDAADTETWLKPGECPAEVVCA